MHIGWNGGLNGEGLSPTSRWQAVKAASDWISFDLRPAGAAAKSLSPR